MFKITIIRIYWLAFLDNTGNARPLDVTIELFFIKSGLSFILNAPQAIATSIILKLSSPHISEKIHGSSCNNLIGSFELLITLRTLSKISSPSLLFKKSPISIGLIGELGHCFNRLSEKLK